MSFQTSGFDDLQKAFAMAIDEVPGEMEKEMDRLARRVIRDVKELTPEITGDLKRSWRKTKALKKGGTVLVDVYNTRHYAPHVEFGHRLKTKDGRVVGYVSGRYMLERAMKDIHENFDEFGLEMLERIARRMGL